MQLSRGLSVHFREESQKGPYKSSHDTCPTVPEVEIVST